MNDEIETKIRRTLRQTGVVQLVGSPEETRSIVERYRDEYTVVIDGAEVEDERDMVHQAMTTIKNVAEVNGEEVQRTWWTVHRFLKHVGEDASIIFINFDEIPTEPENLQRTVSQYIKALFDQTKSNIFLTARDGSAIFVQNRDLTGRVRTIEVEKN